MVIIFNFSCSTWPRTTTGDIVRFAFCFSISFCHKITIVDTYDGMTTALPLSLALESNRKKKSRFCSGNERHSLHLVANLFAWNINFNGHRGDIQFRSNVHVYATNSQTNIYSYYTLISIKYTIYLFIYSKLEAVRRNVEQIMPFECA